MDVLIGAYAGSHNVQLGERVAVTNTETETETHKLHKVYVQNVVEIRTVLFVVS